MAKSLQPSGCRENKTEGKKMEEKIGSPRTAPAPLLGWLIAPLAVLLAIAAIKVAGISFDLNLDNMMPMLVIVVAGILGTVPRILRNNDMIPFGPSTLSLATLGVAMVGHQAITHLSDLGAFTALQFLVVTFVVYFFDSRARYEWSTVTIFTAIGINIGMVASNFYNGELTTIFERSEGGFVSTLNLQRQALGYIFFSYLMIFLLLGLLVAVLSRGILNAESEEGWFGKIKSAQGLWNKSTLPLQIAILVWILAHMASLWHFDSVEMYDKLGITTEADYHGHFGFWAAFFTGIVAFIVAGMVSERWHTRAMLLGSMWGLYQVSSWYEKGMWQAEQLEGTWGALIWLGLTFFICVGIYMISTHEKWGGWSNKEDHEMSGARKFWNAHWASIMIGMAFFFGLVIRMQWYVVPSMNAYGTGNWDMTGGSDPWYMKRVVDYILANEAHLIMDADRAYPLGGVNPRPPLFTWSIAILAMILEPMLGDDAVWYAMLGLPAVYGALTIFPIATIAKDHFGKSTAVVAAWLISFMPAHVSHSTWALADHDAFVMLFISLGFMYWMKAMKYSGSDRITRKSSPKISSILASFGTVARERQAAMSFAILAGVSFGVASLGWKGFVVGPSILFLAYFVQVALNMFRRRDSTTINTLFLTMLGVNLLMAIPFYGHPQFDLIFNGTGLQPFMFVLGFSIVIAYITTGFRDKPWLLVLGTLTVAAMVFFTILWALKQLEWSNAWDVLFTGSGYFTKTKIFGTVAEANAPDRGQLFAQLGPIVLVLALTMGIYSIWSSLRTRNQSHLVFGIWIFAATYMAWTAARFMFNATPAVAVLGAWGITALWRRANWAGLQKAWKKHGIRTPADRISGARKAVWRTPSFSAILLIIVLLGGQQFTYGLDAAIPSSVESEDELDESIFNMIPDAFRWELAGFSILDSSSYSGNWYLGSFGSGFNDQGWNGAYEWLANQDTQDEFSDKPAFVSWWDYGFQALDTGEHPSVSDNFQSGIPASGNMLLARSQDDLISMFIWQLAQGDMSYSNSNGDGYELTSGFENVLDNHLSSEQLELFQSSQQNVDYDDMKQMIDDYSFKVIQTNREVVMAEGHHRTDGISDTSDTYWRIYEDGERILCDVVVSTSCSDGDWSSFEDANLTFNNEVRSGQESTYDTTHYIFGEYWYTEDLMSEFSSVSTHIHRKNARLALAVQLLSDSLDSDGITDLYHDLIGLEIYNVQDYEGLPGETIKRDHEIRYFAIDNRLYPRAGKYTQDYNYNQGQPMGIFGAPTILSGQDISTYMDEVYETTRGGIPQELTREQVDEAMTDDFLDQQAGLDVDPLQVEDVRVDHNPAFFDTMLSRTYVGYGASSLGVNVDLGNPQPAQHFGQSGTPGSYLQQALPMPGAMMNHFVIANWYNEDNNLSFGQTNTLVKILKYYSGAEVSGQVTMSDTGEPIPGARLLVERDAFSGEGSEDLDNDTYWIPIGFTDADDEGMWSFDAPAGKIRVSAFTGTLNFTSARDSIVDGSFAQNLNDVLNEFNEDRTVNEVTAILGNVANMTWLGEVQMNVTGEQANRTESVTETMDIQVSSSGISGMVTWTGDEIFNGEPLVDTDIVLRSTFGISDEVTLTTTNGSFTTDETRIIQGTGEVTFTENGTFVSEGIASAIDFSGTFTRNVNEGRTFVANGTWNGAGTIKASWINLESSEIPACDVDPNDSTNVSMPVNQTVCLKDDSGSLPIYMIDGVVEADGRFTSESNTILIQEIELSSFEGIGTFEGTGTFNGTGQFTGIGDFSGDLVKPGSFYQTGLVPGDYEVFAQLENGREVKLPQIISVGLTPSYDIDMTIPGSVLRGNITDSEGNPMDNITFEWNDLLLDDGFSEIATNSTGGYNFGPISTGEYQVRIDLDNDTFFEVNQTISVGNVSSTLSPISVIPDMYDISVQLTSPVNDSNGEDLLSLDNRSLDLASEFGALVTVYSDENGVINTELLPGTYSLFDSNSEEFLLFESFELVDEDLSITMDYSISSTVSGQLMVYTADFDQNWTTEEAETNSTPASNVNIVFSSGDLTLEAVSDLQGNFTINLPGDLSFQMIASSTGNFGGSTYFAIDNSTTVDLGSIYLEQLHTLSGVLYTYDNNSTWDSSMFKDYLPTVTVTNADGVYWNSQVSEAGIFSLALSKDTYDVTIDDETLSVSPLIGHVVTENFTTNSVELIANPSSQSVKFNVFIDSADNGSFEYGIPVNSNFTVSSTLLSDGVINVTAANYTTDGEVFLDLLPGKYTVMVENNPIGSENVSDFNNMYVTTDIFVSLGDDQKNQSIYFANQWLVEGVLKDHNGVELKADFSLYNESRNDWHDLSSSLTGEFSSYVEAGDWIMIVSPIVGENNTTLLRMPLTVSDNSTLRTGMDLQMVNSMQINLQLLENLTDNPIENTRVIAVSNDGFGNVTLKSSDNNGNISDDLMPGSWSLFLDNVGANRSLSLDTYDSPFTIADAVDGSVDLETVHADVTVLIEGTVYWDSDGDNVDLADEWIVGANLTVTSIASGFSEVVTTDEDGNWELFVPIRDVYNVTVEKLGYGTVFFEMENETGFAVEDYAVTQDILMEADNVDVSGTIQTSLSNPASHLDGASIMLYPSSESEFEPISVVGTYLDGTLSWNETITPGKWTVVVQSPNVDENGGGVAVGYLNADISSGGVLEMNMSTGGWVEISTNWEDVKLDNYHTGSSDTVGYAMIQSEVEVTFDLSLGSSWNYTVDTNGEIRVLMPLGEVQLTSEFSTIQHERNLSMDYSFTSTPTVEQGILDITMDYSRRINSKTSMEIDITSIVNATFNSVAELNAIESEDGYKTIEFEVDTVYEGTESNDGFVITGSVMSNMDSNLWSIEFYNGSGWATSAEVTMGIGESLSDDSVSNTSTVKARITMPNASSAWSFDDGHQITIRLENDGGISSSQNVKVFIPETYGIEVSDIVEETGVSPGGSSTFSFTITNTGNGNDNIKIEHTNSLGTGWEVSPGLTYLNITKGDFRSQTFTVYAPSDFEEGEVQAWITVSSEDGITNTTVEVDIYSARISLSVEQSSVNEKSYQNEIGGGELIIPVENSGFRSAGTVIVYANRTDDAGVTLESFTPQTISVGAGQTVDAVFQLNATSKIDQRYAVSVDVQGDDVNFTSKNVEPFDFDLPTKLNVEEDTSVWLMVIIFALTILVAYGGLKVARNKSSTRF